MLVFVLSVVDANIIRTVTSLALVLMIVLT